MTIFGTMKRVSRVKGNATSDIQKFGLCREVICEGRHERKKEARGVRIRDEKVNKKSIVMLAAY